MSRSARRASGILHRMRGTGHYNLALGIVATAQGIGASLSGLEAGLIVDHFGYNAAFATSAAVGLAALAVLGLALVARLAALPPR